MPGVAAPLHTSGPWAAQHSRGNTMESVYPKRVSSVLSLKFIEEVSLALYQGLTLVGP